ncbi:MAG: hypothetical protein HYR85_08400 [Planctomycetes bacterium]|nr:hypothetical protein [Planctomycetota bacterium]MBI3845313.1 hypothetical protein [Planctomycetota bacterium]
MLLYALTGEARYSDAALKGARFDIDDAANAEKGAKPGEHPYVPPSYCCGVAGVVDFFCDLYPVTGDSAHAAFARNAGSYLVTVAIADGEGRKWKNGATAPSGPVASKATDCNVDLMIGASGEALALLRVLSLDRPQEPVRWLPDRAVTVAPVAK